MSHLLKITAIVLTLWTTSITSVQAQPYLVPTDMELFQTETISGCAPPSICLCPIMYTGTLDGSYHLRPLQPWLLPLAEYAVEDILWISNPVGGQQPVTITGSGLYTVDIASGTHSMDLNLMINGVATTYTSGGFVDESPSSQIGVSIYIYTQISGCLHDGIQLQSFAAPAGPRFIRGDANLDSSVNIADYVQILSQLFSPLPVQPPCSDASDTNDDGVLNIADVIYGLADLFDIGPDVPAPFPNCGIDPTADSLGCDNPVCP